MSAQENKQVIQELEHIQSLLNEKIIKANFLDIHSDERFYKKMQALHENLGVLEKPAVFSNFPVFPLEESYYEATKKDAESKKPTFRIALIITIALVVLYFITRAEILNTIAVIGIFATAILGCIYNASKKQYIKKKKEYEKSVEEYNKTNKAFLEAIENFDEEKIKYTDLAKEYSKKYTETYNEYMNAVREKFEAEEEATERIAVIEEELKANSTIVSDYYHLIGQIVTNLKSGRADDYKEALNIAIREEREEKERLQMLAKEEERNRILAMQVEEERRHNEQVERQQKEHDEALLREQKRNNAEMAKQANRQEMLGRSKCSSCAHSHNCPEFIKGSGAGLTCGGYVPRKR